MSLAREQIQPLLKASTMKIWEKLGTSGDFTASTDKCFTFEIEGNLDTYIALI